MLAKKAILWILIGVNNVFALGLLGIVFLAGPGQGAEGVSPSDAVVMMRLAVYAFSVSLIFAGVTFLLTYLFRKLFHYSGFAPLQVSIANFVFLILAFVVIYFSVFGFSDQ